MMSDKSNPHSVLAHLSPAQCAQVAQVSRWTIMRAIKRQELKAIRDNKNHWKVDSLELNRWCAFTVRTVDSVHNTHTQNDSIETLSKIAALEAENNQLRERLSEVKEDRDAWREMAQRRRWWSFIKRSP